MEPFFLGKEDKNCTIDKKVRIETYGCQMNVHDSEEIRKYLIIFDERIADHIMDYIVMCSELCDKLNNTKDYKKINFSWYKD